MRCSTCAEENPVGLSACRSCGSPLSAAEAAPQGNVLPSGTVLQGGAFVLGGVLGQGGFGITYKGRDARLNRAVALKEFFPQTQGCLRRGTTVHPGGGITIGEFHEERNKFLEEGRRLAQFQHQGIVKVFSLFEENNTAYMVMELLSGRTLLKMVEEDGPIDERRLVPFIEQVANALAVVHQTNVIHRDVKPENIMVTPEGRAVLVDFGTARDFAAGKTRTMTTMLTPGYAPLEQYGQHARFGIVTDLYALGATTYHLLTGQLPIQATDRAAGVEMAAPQRLNRSITRPVSDAVMWAMEMRVDKRPQNAADFIQALRGARPAPVNGRANGPDPIPQSAPNPYQEADASWILGLEADPIPQSAPNPYQSRIEQLIAEKEAAPQPSQTKYDLRIREITAELARISSSLQIQPADCPCCHQSSLKSVEGEKTSLCPVCSGAQLKSKKIDHTLCPVCACGHLFRTVLDSQRMFCPICRSRSLREEKRKRFGLPIDLWWVCPGCRAEFDVVLGGRAKLVGAGDDPLGVGKDYLGATKSISDWQKLSPLSDRRWDCDGCAARFYEIGQSQLCLDWIEHDPRGVEDKILGKTYFRTYWAKIANGLSTKVGTTYCPACKADFDFDAVDKTLRLLECDRHSFPRAVSLLSQAFDIPSWSLFAAGKTSLVPGWFCSGCRAEFDKDGSGMKLVAVPSKFNDWVGATMSLDAWHRKLRGLPSEKEEAQLKNELVRLQCDAQQELTYLRAVEQERRSGIPKQIEALVKKSYVEGFISLGTRTTTIEIGKDNRVVWESAVCRLKQRTTNDMQYWEADGEGALVVTDQRVIFQADTGATWSIPLAKIVSTNAGHHGLFGTTEVCVLGLENRQKRVGFVVLETAVVVPFGSDAFHFKLTSRDLQESLKSRRGG